MAIKVSRFSVYRPQQVLAMSRPLRELKAHIFKLQGVLGAVVRIKDIGGSIGRRHDD